MKGIIQVIAGFFNWSSKRSQLLEFNQITMYYRPLRQGKNISIASWDNFISQYRQFPFFTVNDCRRSRRARERRGIIDRGLTSGGVPPSWGVIMIKEIETVWAWQEPLVHYTHGVPYTYTKVARLGHPTSSHILFMKRFKSLYYV